MVVDGCFWHACPDHRHRLRANSEWWRWKFEANVARDRDTDRYLAELGWNVLRVWEHKPAGVAVDRVEALLDGLSGAVGEQESQE